MDSVHERRIIAHIRRKRAEEVTDALLMLDIHLEVSHHDNPAVSADALLAPAKFPRLHIALHDVDAVLLVKRDARNLVEANNVVLADQAPLPGAIIDEHSCNRCFATGNQMSVGRDLLKQMTLACSPGTKLHHVIIALYEWDHT